RCSRTGTASAKRQAGTLSGSCRRFTLVFFRGRLNESCFASGLRRVCLESPMPPSESATSSCQTLAAWLQDARRRTAELIGDLDDEQLMGPRLAIVNPLLWEIGHIAWFQEKWTLQHCWRERPAGASALYDSSAVAHETRWELLLPDRRQTIRYLQEVRDRLVDR